MDNNTSSINLFIGIYLIQQIIVKGVYVMTVNDVYAGSKSDRLGSTIKSSYDAELLALREAYHHATKMESVLISFGYLNVKIIIKADNMSVIHTIRRNTKNGKAMNRVYVNCIAELKREYLEGNFEIEHISGLENPANLFTKPSLDKFKELIMVKLSVKL